MVLPELHFESPTQEEASAETAKGQTQLILVAAEPIQPEQPVGEPFA